MGFIGIAIAKFVVNAVILYAGDRFFTAFTVTGGIKALLIAAFTITLLNIFLKPILRLISLPLIWLSLGLFLIVINIAMLWIADLLLSSITFGDFSSMIVLSIIIGFVNSIL